jgi:DNA-binding transcriptional MerR regulator
VRFHHQITAAHDKGRNRRHFGAEAPADRRAAQQRLYTATDVERLVLRRRCRDFGFSITQMRELLALSLDRDGDCQSVRGIAQGHLDRLRQRLADLTALERQVAGFVAACDDAGRGGMPAECNSLVSMRVLKMPDGLPARP